MQVIMHLYTNYIKPKDIFDVAEAGKRDFTDKKLGLVDAYVYGM
jgi:predicted nucleic acid-binding protein